MRIRILLDEDMQQTITSRSGGFSAYAAGALPPYETALVSLAREREERADETGQPRTAAQQSNLWLNEASYESGLTVEDRSPHEVQ